MGLIWDIHVKLFTNPYYPRQLQAIPSKIMVPRLLHGIQNGVEEMCIPRFSR